MSSDMIHGALYQGIDAGGSKTSAALMDQNGVVRGYGTGSAANFIHVPPAAIVEAIKAAAAGALSDAGVESAEIKAAAVCMAGFAPWEESAARKLLDPVLAPAQTLYLRDLDAALASAVGAGPGLIVIAGTGSVAYGRSPNGQTHRSGGWGYLIGDEGSGFWLGCSAIRHTLQGFDGRAERGPLFNIVCTTAGAHDPVELDRVVYHGHWTPADFAAYAPLVFQAAAEGDIAAGALLSQAASDLAAQAGAVIRELDLRGVGCGIVGGLWQSGGLLLEPFTRLVEGFSREIDVIKPLISPAEGAALLALQADDISISPAQVQRFSGGRG